MAELLGIVAGGAGLASLAVQLGEGVVKIKRLYKSYDEAPRRLKDLSEDLEVFVLSLRILETDRQQHDDLDRTVLERCILYCSRAAAEVSAAVDKCEAALQKSNKKGRLRTALDQPSIVQLCNDLERVKSSLMFAFSLYKAERQKRDAALLLDRLDQISASVQQLPRSQLIVPLVDEVTSSSSVVPQLNPPSQSRGNTLHEAVGRKQHCARRERSSCQIRRLRLSPWFTSRVWEISFNVAQFGWDFSMRTCNLVPENSLIFEACREGDLAEVQALFQTGQASPYDCAYRPGFSPSGMTVLTAAAGSSNLQLCRYLVGAIGFPVEPVDAEDPLDAFARNCFRNQNISTDEATDMYRLLMTRPAWGDEGSDRTDRLNALWWHLCPDPLCIRLVKENLSATFSKYSSQQIVDLALQDWIGCDYKLPAMVLEKLSKQQVDQDTAQARDNIGRTALHLIAEQLSWAETVPPDWIDFVRQLLTNGADIHRRTNVGETAFIALLSHSAKHPTFIVRHWVQLLQAVGTDLAEYGRVEKSLWTAWFPLVNVLGRWKIQDWTYGGNTADWNIKYVWLLDIDIYELQSAPGTWHSNDEYSIRTICWCPEPEDETGYPERWTRGRSVTLSHFQSWDSVDDGMEPAYAALQSELNRVQDDSGTIMRLMENSPRTGIRLRSSSQPARMKRNGYEPSRRWFPSAHICIGDGRLKVERGERRACAKGIHGQSAQATANLYENIRREMRLFQTRYSNARELQALPYAAYHRRWKRDGPPVFDNG